MAGAQKKISALPSVSPATTDSVPIYQTSSGLTKRTTIANFNTLLFNNIPADVAGGWTTPSDTVSSVTPNGNRSYTVVTGATQAASISAGFRFRTTRTVAAPTQCTLLNGTTQYWVKTTPNKLTFTDDFVVSLHIKPTAYNASTSVIASRYNGTSGWQLILEATGQITLAGYNAGSANFSYVRSYQSLPLNKWSHLTVQLDMSSFTATPTTSYVMFDGLDVPATVARAGTNPTALIQAGNLEIGGGNGGLLPFSGKISQVAIFNAKVTQATMRGYISQGLSGSETSLASAYSFNNSTNDLNTTTPNNLSAGAGAPTATTADSPFGGQADGTISTTLDYGIVQKISGTSITIQVAEGCTIPTSGGVSQYSYAPVKSPYGFPSQRGKWTIMAFVTAQSVQGTASASTWYNVGSHQLNIPIGSWDISYQSSPGGNTSAATFVIRAALSTANNTASDLEFIAEAAVASPTALVAPIYKRRSRDLSVATIYYLNLSFSSGSGTVNLFNVDLASIGNALIEAENAYL